LIDPLIQIQALVEFATNAPGYGPLQNDTILKQVNKAFYGKNGCKDQQEACYAAKNNALSDKICVAADDYCVRLYNQHPELSQLTVIACQGNEVGDPVLDGYDAYDLRQNASASFPPAYYTKYLADPSVLKKIGAEVPYLECSGQVNDNFVPTGDVRD